ncbi:sulfite exporter TauE/SafE family protein [Phyllobacterium salinisoli]|nr:sulfite exporter TauE/SafE family protein [Phyllobacterium salinisoli]
MPDFFRIAFAPYSDTQLSFLLASAFIAGLARGFSGFGGALIFVPLASSVVGPKLAAPLLLIIDGVGALGMIPNAIRQANRHEVLTMSIGALIGVPLGVAALAMIDPLAVRWGIVVTVVLFLALLVSGWRYHNQPSPLLTICVGSLAGFFSGTAQIGGPPVIAYWLGGTMPVGIVRANIVLYFAISTVISTISYVIGGLFVASLAAFALVVGPSYALGLYLGSLLFGQASDRLFRRICYWMIGAAALISLPLLDPFLR